MTARDLFTEDHTTEAKATLRPGSVAVSERMEADPCTGDVKESSNLSGGAILPSRARICGECQRGTLNEFGWVQCAEAGTKSEWLSPTAPCRRVHAFIPLKIEVVVRRAAQAGIDQAVAHAERVRPGWSNDALGFIRSFAEKNKGKRLTGYELVQHSVAVGFEQPPTPQGWGGPLQRASRTGLIVKVGSVPDPNPARHGSDVPLWEVA